MDENDLLEHAVINQLETDFDDQDFDAMSEMIQCLIQVEDAKKILIEYLSDSGKENWIEQKTVKRW